MFNSPGSFVEDHDELVMKLAQFMIQMFREFEAKEVIDAVYALWLALLSFVASQMDRAALIGYLTPFWNAMSQHSIDVKIAVDDNSYSDYAGIYN